MLYHLRRFCSIQLDMINMTCERQFDRDVGVTAQDQFKACSRHLYDEALHKNYKTHTTMPSICR
jgi:hypothetical protein